MSRDEASDEKKSGERGDERPERDDDEFPGLDGLIGTFMGEPSLWPVLIVVLGSGGAFGAALLVLSFVDRNPFAAVALLLIGGMTLDLAVRSRRSPKLRNLARLVGLLWLAAGGLAGLAIYTGIASV
jgi:hypothetical protein